MSEFNNPLLDPRIPGSDVGVPGALLNGTFWYWNTAISEGTVRHRRGLYRARKRVKQLAFVLSAVFLALAVLSLVLAQGAPLIDGTFFSLANPAALFLALAGLALLFALYRRFVTDSRGGPMIIGPQAVVLPKGAAAEAVVLPAPEAVEQRADIATALDFDAYTSVEDAYLIAEGSAHAEVGPLHIFAGALSSGATQIVLARLGLTMEDVKEPLKRRLVEQPTGQTYLGRNFSAVAAAALVYALQNKRKQVGSLDLFMGAVQQEPFLAEIFAAKGVPLEELDQVLAWMRVRDDYRDRYLAARASAVYKPKSNMNRAMTAVATPFLDAVSEDYTRLSADGRTELMMGRGDEITAIMRAIEGGGQSVVLVGEPGVGKGSIIEGIADLMVAEEVPAVLQDKRLLKISVPHIVSAQGGTGAEERLLHALQQVARSGNIVLVIEDIHTLVSQGGGVDLASILAGELGKGYTFVLATTTPRGYTEVLERSVLAPRLQKIVIAEPDRKAAIAILQSKMIMIEGRHKVIFTFAALAACVDLSARYMHDAMLPQKAIELAEEVALTVGKRAEKLAFVKQADVAALVSERTKIPVTEVKQEEGEKLLHLEEKLHERVIGQEPAIKAIASALRRARTALRSGNKPIANFLFLGPTGVGKTELAKATAETYFGAETAMIRFDMSEYQDQASITRLIGGNQQAGLLTEAVRKSPFALVLLDELEKAHPDILNLFLQVMDDGRLTDGLGRTVDFTNVILIATSNAGTQFIQDEVTRGADLASIKQALVEQELRQIYRPEFLNRFDDIVVFSPLSMEDVVAIAYLMIAKTKARLAEKGVALEVTDAAVHELAAQGYDPKFGARPLRRTVQEKLENPLADFLLKGEVGRRDTVVLDVGGQISVKKAEAL